MSSGGGDGAKSTNYLLDDTIGESNIGFGRSLSYDLNAGYRQPNGGTYLAMSCDPVTDLGTITFTGQRTVDNTCTVITDNDAGYSLSWAVRTGSGGTNTGHMISTTPPHTDTIPPYDAAQTGLVGYWKLDETAGGSTVKDLSGNGNNGTPSGASGTNNKPQPSTSVPANMNTVDLRSLNFDGTDDRVDVGNAAALNITGNAITLSAWIYDDGTSGVNGYIMGKVTGTHKYAFLVNHANQTIDFSLNTGSVTTYGAPGGVGGLDSMHNKWNLVNEVYDGTNMMIYINGVLVGSTPKTGNIVSNTDGFAIGDRGTVANTPFKGGIDDVRVYNRALSAAEIKALYNEPHTWSVAASKSYWGSRLRSSSTDADSKWGTDGGSEKWLNVGDGSYSVVSRTSRTSVAGSTEIFQFRAEVGATAIQSNGLYNTTVMFTASAL